MLGAVSLFASDAEQNTGSPAAVTSSPQVRADQAFRDAYRRFHTDTNNHAYAWQFARACFDLAEFATNNATRASLAETGIRVCRRVIAREPARAEAHYYLGLNLGQLARTKTLGALRIVNEMEKVFTAARTLDERFDFAGPDRALGLLYLEAPAFGSIGNRSKARLHLRRAVELAPDYPSNRLNLIEASLRWGDHRQASTEIKALADLLPAAREKFSGERWAASWSDWDDRLARAKKTLAETSTR